MIFSMRAHSPQSSSVKNRRIRPSFIPRALSCACATVGAQITSRPAGPAWAEPVGEVVEGADMEAPSTAGVGVSCASKAKAAKTIRFPSVDYSRRATYNAQAYRAIPSARGMPVRAADRPGSSVGRARD